MKYEVLVDGVGRSLEVDRDVDRIATSSPRVRLDERIIDVDAVEIVPGTFSILIAGRVFEARVLPGKDNLSVRCAGRDFAVEVRDPRAWRGSRSSVLEAEGRQQVPAPMPGKVVRVLVAAGDVVEAGQGLIVVEAMKMQNEIRAPKGGTIERVLAREGQAVSAGETLVVIG